MNYIKAQKEIFNSLCSGGRLGKFWIDNNNILITPNGFMAYIFPENTIMFNLEKIKDIEKVPVLEVIRPENELTITLDARIDDRNRKLMRRLKGYHWNVFVDEKYLSCYQNPHFYQETKNRAVVVTEDISVTKKNVPVGIIMPILASWDDGTYYTDMGEKEKR